MYWRDIVAAAQGLDAKSIGRQSASRPMLSQAVYQNGCASESLLLFAEADDYKRAGADPGNWVVLCPPEGDKGGSDPIAQANGTPSPESIVARPQDCVLVLHDRAEFRKFYGTCVRLFNEEQALHLGLEKVNQLVQSDAGLQRIVDEISDMYDAPVNVIDNAMNVLAYSERRFVDPQLHEEDVRGRLDNRVVSKIKRQSLLSGKRRHIQPIKLDLGIRDADMPANYLTFIYSKNMPIASFSVFPPSGELSRIQKRVLVSLSQALSAELQKSSFYTLNKSNLYTHLISTIVNAKAEDDLADVPERLKLFGYELKANIQIAYADASRSDYTALELRTLAARLQKQIPHSIYSLQENEIIYLASSDERECITTGVVDGVREFLRQADIVVGVSNPAPGLGHAGSLLTQAMRAVETGKVALPGRSVYLFENLQLYDMVNRAAPNNAMALYAYWPLTALHNRDLEKGSQLVRTLFAYLVENQSLQRACQKLHVHPNTLRYRLKQIGDIMGDYESGPAIARIFVTFAILTSQGRLEEWLGGEWDFEQTGDYRIPR